MKNYFKKPLFYAPLAAVLLIFPLSVFLGFVYGIKYLNSGVSYRQFEIRTTGLRVSWNFNFRAEELSFYGEDIFVQGHGLHLKFNPFAPGFLKSPFFQVFVDSLRYRTSSKKKTAEGQTDKNRTLSGMDIPDIRIPVKFSAFISHFDMLDSVGRPGISADSIQMHNLGGRTLKMEARNISAAVWPLAAPDISLEYHTSKKERIIMCNVTLATDSVTFTLNQKKAGQPVSGKASAAVSEPLKFFPEIAGRSIFYPTNAGLVLDFILDSVPKVSGDLVFQTIEKTFIARMPLFISPHNCRLGFSTENGILDITMGGKGDLEEQFMLNLRASLAGWNRDAGIGAFLKSANVDVEGYLRNYSWTISSWALPLDVEIERAVVNMQGLTGKFYSADGSAIMGSLGWAEGFTAQYTASFTPKERWAVIWTNGHLQYASHFMTGAFSRGKLAAKSKIYQVNAYGARCDSLLASQSLTIDGYFLDSAVVFYNDIPWNVKGRVLWKKGEKGLQFTSDNSELGRAVFSMPAFNDLNASVSGLHVREYPYPPLAPVFQLDPVVTGIFTWDVGKKTGHSDATLAFNWLEKPVSAAVEVRWDSEAFRVERLKAGHENESISAAGSVKLDGKHFYQVYQSGLEDIENFYLDISGLDLGGWVKSYRDSILQSAQIHGSLAYEKNGGFSGRLAAENLVFYKTDTLFQISDAVVTGSGSDIFLTTVFNSDKTEILNDSIYVSIIDIFDKHPRVRAELSVGEDLQVHLNGQIESGGYVSSTISATGSLSIPGDTMKLADIDISGTAVFPLSSRSSKALEMNGNLNRAVFKWQEMAPFNISSPVRVTPRGAEFPNIKISNSVGQQLNGYGFFSFVGENDAEFHLQGETMDVRLSDQNRLVLNKIQADFMTDSTGRILRLSLSSGTCQSAFPTFYLGGSITDVDLSYHIPKDRMHNLRSNTLSGKMNIRDVYFKYENFGISQFQNLFKRSARKKVRRQSAPLNMNIQFSTLGPNNKVDTDFLKFTFDGEGLIYGAYPQLNMRGEVNSISGVFGVVSKEYSLDELALRWDGEPITEGSINMSAVKWLASNCESPDTLDQCSMEFYLRGTLQSMDFSYGGSCVSDLGESWNPAVLLNSAAKGCYDPSFSGDASYAFIEGQLSHLLTRGLHKWSGNWIEQTRVEGLKNWRKDETASSDGQVTSLEPVTIEVETIEKWRLRIRAKSAYFPGSAEANPWEHEGAVVWRPPLEHVVDNDTWKHRVRKRVQIESMLKTGTSQQALSGQEEQQKDLRYQLGMRYQYEFWNIW